MASKVTSMTTTKADHVLDVVFTNTGSVEIGAFSDFAFGDPILRQSLLHDNPLQQASLSADNKHMYWKTLADTLRNNPIILVGTMQRYLIDVSEKTFGCFPIRNDKRGRWKQNILEFKPNWITPGTMKVPPREITYTVDAREYTAAYTGEAFESDYAALGTPEGMALFDMMFTQVAADVMRVIVYNMYNTFMEEYTSYVSPGLRFPFEARIPDTPQKAFEYFFNTQAFALNKRPQAIHNLIAHGGRMFEGAREPGVALLIMSEDVKRFIRVMDTTNLDYSDTGPSAIANRSTPTNAGSIRGIEVMTIQMLAQDNSNTFNDTIFTHRWQMGGVARFVEPSAYVQPEKYRSTDRNGRWSSCYADRPEEFSFLDGLSHLFEFVPLDYEPRPEEIGVAPGALDLDLLFGLADNADRMFRLTACRFEHNETALSQFLQHVRGDAKWPNGHPDHKDASDEMETDRYFPIFTFGEIAPRFLRDDNLRLPFATMRTQILARLSDDERALLERGFAFAKRLATPNFVPNIEEIEARYGKIASTVQTSMNEEGKGVAVSVSARAPGGVFQIDGARVTDNSLPYGLGTYHGFYSLLSSVNTAAASKFDAESMEMAKAIVPVFEKFVTILLEINKHHPALDGDSLPTYYDELPTFNRICVAAWNYIVEGGYSPHVTVITEAGSRIGKLVFLHFDVDVDGKAKDHDALAAGFHGALYHDTLPYYPVGETKRLHASRWFYDQLVAMQLPRTATRLLAASPWKNADFARRWAEARGAAVWDRIARFTVLLQEINLNGITGWWDANVAIPLGLAVVRPFEEAIMDAIVLASQKQLGFTAVSGLDNIISFDGNSQHYSVQIMGGFRTIPTNHKGWIVLDRVRGRRVVGGKGNRYINANPESTGAKVLRYGTPEFNDITRANFGNAELLGQFSMIPLAEGYNTSIDNPFAERHYPLTGFWDKNDFVGMLANSYSFQDVYDAPLGINQFLFNYIFPELITNKPKIEVSPLKATTAELSEMWHYNTYVHQITQWVKNPLTGGWDEIKDAHPCGREENDIRGIQSSVLPVRREPIKPNRGLPPKFAQV